MAFDVWSVILAAGAGRRLAPITGGVPKQFWRPRGETSLLDDTVSRLASLVPEARTVTIVDQSHRPYVNAFPMSERLGDIVYQPDVLKDLAAQAANEKLVLTSLMVKLRCQRPADRCLIPAG